MNHSLNARGETTKPTRRATANVTIADYLIQRLRDYGVHDLFGIPGDYVLSFYSELENSPINVIGCTREDCAGFAADAYARLNGMGALCVTYCVGGMSVCNSVAGAFAEKSPVVVISGAPGLDERHRGVLLHHMVRDFRTQADVFEKFTIASTELTDPMTAFSEIDRVLDACDHYKRPVYIELPRDMVHVIPPVAHGFRGTVQNSDADATSEAVSDAIDRLKHAKRPVILAGVETHRFRLQDELLQFAESASIPIATTMLGKSVVSEKHPLFIGLYEGAIGDANVTQIVEQSDWLLLLGAFLSDINLGIYTAKLDPSRCVYATSESLRVSHHHYHDVELKQFLSGLIEASKDLPPRPMPKTQTRNKKKAKTGRDNTQLQTSWMVEQLNERLDPDTIVIADVGDSLFAATELTIHERTEFLSPAYYTSMGFSIPAALGAATARPDHRIVVLVGDGAFQMTGQELSTLVYHNHNPVIILLDNHGYGTERYLHAGEWKYNEVAKWNYTELMKVYGRGEAYKVETKDSFLETLDRVWNSPDHPHLIHAVLEENDASDTLKKLAERMKEKV
ncbi:Indole-3-pyruvate decarboxylase [Novipirellula aureliae]|uniref:Indole-3-pyruvate decarboxylase n=1 Tax=Novipirellula aureliae TaxID=2527966 RepID=A0A5C6E5J3_9BACT|nr:thiamine pyrophosphate-dependent enzyme [Novipirellula aureliae]TWU43784.1 Indole-3-pyruvate decarboxylase [Novipirellula aureliae]